ncbi:unnamed protein product [Adineta steineri]|uniref:Uncharacterized protein n=2 Tax=Adineta steineri TaxID=433720 RepID=A0A815B5J3_9BILA|nr:unnamed protein product [Adineta steineri]CAF3784324.1 unnamed protein product [Adineta steineri]
MEGSYDIHHKNEVNQFLVEALKIPSLTELLVSLGTGDDLLSIHANRVAMILQSIVSSASTKIANLTLIYPRGLLQLKSGIQIASVKRLSVTIHFAKTLMQLINVTPNLEELSLSIMMFDDTDLLKSIKLPQTLQKLHLEGGTYDYKKFSYEQPTFEMIRIFLDVFKHHIQSLTLIMNNADKKFATFDNFQSLSNFKLVNLKKLVVTSRSKMFSAGFSRLLLKIVDLSPNLNSLSISSGTNPNNLIKQLQRIMPKKYGKQFLHFELFLESNSKQWEFSLELSKMLPNLKTISIHGEQRFLDNCFTSLIEFVEDLQTHFKKLARLTIKTYGSNTDAFGRYENDLKKLSKQTNNPIYYTAKDQGVANYFLDIWL